jgi:hypothetical protein
LVSLAADGRADDRRRQIRARVRELVADLPEDDPVRAYADAKAELLERLAFASTKAENSEPESRERIGWETIPSSAPASAPLPRAGEPLVPPRAPSSRGVTAR